MGDYGSRIKAAREAAGLTQEQLGEKLGVTGVTIMRYEKNQREPRQKQLERIAAALGIHVLDLMGIGQELDKYVDEIKLPSDATQGDIERVWDVYGGKTVRDIYDELSDEGKARFWQEAVQPLQAELDEAFNALNDKGQQKVVEYARDLLPTHRRSDSPAADQEEEE